MHVLVATGDTDLLKRLAVALIQAGLEVGTARDGQQVVERWQAEQPDLFVLDAALPQVNGLEVCRHIREHSPTPIVLLMADAVDEDAIVRGLELGADEVLVSSRSTRLMVAQMHAVVRRAALAATTAHSHTLCAGDLVVDLRLHQVVKADAVIRLTRLEFRLLCLLMATVGHVVPYSRLVQDAWGYPDEPTPHLLRAHMSRLRRKLGLHGAGGTAIESILGIGYRLSVRSSMLALT